MHAMKGICTNVFKNQLNQTQKVGENGCKKENR